MDNRVAPPAEKELKDALDRWSTGSDADPPIFETKQQLLMFAAGVGRYLGQQEPDGKRDSGAAIRFDIFEKNLDDTYLFALASEATGGLTVLRESRGDEVVAIFESFARAGLREMVARVDKHGGDPLSIFLDLALEAAGDADESDIPEGLEPSVFRKLVKE